MTLESAFPQNVTVSTICSRGGYAPNSVYYLYLYNDVELGNTQFGLTTRCFAHIKELVKSLGNSANPTEESVKERLRLFYRIEQNEAFFGKKIVLVEGETEFFTLPIYAKAQGFSFNKEGVTIVNCGSKSNIPYFYCLFKKCFKLPTFVIVDGDKTKIEAVVQKQDPKLNKYLQTMLGIEKPEDSLDQTNLTENYVFFSEDFEEFIASQFDDKMSYQKLISESENKYKGKGEFKWYKQRYVASEIVKPAESGECIYDKGFEELKRLINYIFSPPYDVANNEVSNDIVRVEDIPF
jgi:predicted ATP-dependent endonuclease of OLD family